MSFTLRFVEEENGRVSIKEVFIGFRTVHTSTGEVLVEVLLNTLKENNINISDFRGQGYGNGANMKGKNKGVQARVLSINSRAFYVPCGCHSLNLVVSNAASSSKDSLTLFGVVKRIYVIFSASVQRWDILKNHVTGLTLKPLNVTRWGSRIDSLKPIRYQIKEIYNALIQISETPQGDIP